MKRNLLVAMLVMCGIAQAFAQTATQPAEKAPAAEAKSGVDGWNISFSSRFQSVYVSPFDKLVWDHPVQQSDLTVFFPKSGCVPGRFYLKLWHSTNFDNTFDDESADEVNYVAGWKGEIGNGVNLNLWMAYLDFHPIGDMPTGGDQIRFFAELDKRFEFELCGKQSVTPFVRFEVPWGLKGYKDNSGLRVYPGISHSWEFVPNWSFVQSANLCLDDGATGFQPAVIGDYKVGLSWRVNQWLTAEVINVRWVAPLSDVTDGREANTIVSTGLVFKY